MPINDEPLSDPALDRLGRDNLAQTIANEVMAADKSTGAVLAVTGPWGSGKTTLVEFAARHLAETGEVRPVWFNPWLFSSTDDLVERFFAELAAQLRGDGKDFAGIVNALSDYGASLAPIHLIPFAGKPVKWLSSIMQIPADINKIREGGTQKQREYLARTLQKSETKLLVIIDDIDRLESIEIRQILKLVRLVGSFPNVVYLLAYDRSRVEQSLEDSALHTSGKEYLKKIVSMSFDVPTIPREVLSSELLNRLEQSAPAESIPGAFDMELWRGVYQEIVFPCIDNLRDVKIYCAALGATVRDLNTEIELSNLLALEALRVFLPDTLRAISSNRLDLTVPTMHQSMFDTQFEARVTNAVNEVIESDKSHAAIVKSAIYHLFPDAARVASIRSADSENMYIYLRSGMVAHYELLSLYLDRFEGTGFGPFRIARDAFYNSSNRQYLKTLFLEQDPDDVPDIMEHLRAFEGRFPDDSIVPVSTAVLNLLRIVPAHSNGFMRKKPALVIAEIVSMLLRQLTTEDEVLEKVADIQSGLDFLSSELLLIQAIGHDQNMGGELVGNESAEKLERAFRERVRRHPVERLAVDRFAFNLIGWHNDAITDDEAAIAFSDSPEMAALLLKGAIITHRSQELGTGTLRVERYFDGKAVQNMFKAPDDALIRKMIEMAKSLECKDPDLLEAIGLANRYLSGESSEGSPEMGHSIARRDVLA